MNRTIWKYGLDLEKVGDHVFVEMPAGAAIVGGLMRPGSGHVLDVYADVNPDAEPVMRALAVRGTGHPAPTAGRHVTVVADPPFVWHVFDLGQQR